MEYRMLGRTGVRVSCLGLGCWMFGGRTNEGDSIAIIDQAIDAGINFLDTANVYHRGRSEEVVGEALKRNGHRSRIVLATKVHRRMADDDPNMEGNSRRHIVEQCEASLRRLQTDYIDLYQIHRPQPAIPIDETLRALDDLIRAGKVRYIGTSTFAAWQLVEAIWVSRELGLNRFICEQPPYNILDRRIERELLPAAQTFGIGIMTWSPLAGGLLTGKYSRNEPPAAGSRFATLEQEPHLQRRWHAGVFDVTEGLARLAEGKGCSMSQLALAWCLTQGGITGCLIGPRTTEQLVDNLGAQQLSLDALERNEVDRLVPPGAMAAPFYEADFGPHRHRL